MTKDELIRYIHENDAGQTENGFAFQMNVPQMGAQVDVLIDSISSTSSEPNMSILSEIVKDLLAFHPKEHEWFQNKIWENYCWNMREGWFGFVDYNGFPNTESANLAHFAIENPTQVIRAIALKHVGICINKEGVRNFDLTFSCPWDPEHGITIGVTNHQFSHMG
ncbi:MAG: hypothetical protein AAFV25_23880 [Bacteroidota bacterium]